MFAADVGVTYSVVHKPNSLTTQTVQLVDNDLYEESDGIQGQSNAKPLNEATELIDNDLYDPSG